MKAEEMLGKRVKYVGGWMRSAGAARATVGIVFALRNGIPGGIYIAAPGFPTIAGQVADWEVVGDDVPVSDARRTLDAGQPWTVEILTDSETVRERVTVTNFRWVLRSDDE